MNNDTAKGNSANPRIEALKERERELRAKIAAGQTRMARRKERDNARLFSIVGATLVQHAGDNPDTFGLMLKQVLGVAVAEERTREFLKSQGWL